MLIVVHVASLHGLLEIVNKSFVTIVSYKHFRLKFLVKGLLQSCGKVAAAQQLYILGGKDSALPSVPIGSTIESSGVLQIFGLLYRTK
jgi:hypothetical protein